MSRRKIKNEELPRLTNEQFKSSDKTPIIVILDDIRSMNNVGSAFRTGDAFLIEKIYLTGITAKPPHREINKTALGATETVDWEYVEDIDLLSVSLQKEGWKIIAVEQIENSTYLNEFTPRRGEKYAIVFGNEVHGVHQSLVDNADLCIEIPQLGTKHSLNVSVSLGVVLWHLTNKMEVLPLR